MTGLGYDSFADAPRVLVTRAAEDAPALAQSLALAGFEPIVVPVLERRWLPLALAEAATAHPDVDWVLITSATTAEVVAVGAPSAWRSARWAAVGPATAERMVELGYRPVRVPDRATAADLVALLGDLGGQKVLYPRADLALPATTSALVAAGAEVVDIVAYENSAPLRYPEHLRASLPVHATTLMSGSAAERVADAVPEADRGKLGRIVAIGPSTVKVARERGLAIDAVAEPHTLGGVVDAVRRLLGR